MTTFIRDTTIGRLVRVATRNKVFQHPEEQPDFELPESYTKALEASSLRSADSKAGSLSAGLHKEENKNDNASPPSPQDDEASPSTDEKETQDDPYQPEVLDDGTVIVNWYSHDDPANPHNWTPGQKLPPTLVVIIYTFAFYLGSSIFTASYDGVIQEFGVSQQAVSLNLSMYVLAYGLGPLLWAPLSEIPSIGRNPPYIVSFAIFVILLVPTALARNFAGLVVLRFLLGFFGSPCLAAGPASLSDMYPFTKLPYALSGWALVSTTGPAVGPVISGFSVPAENWRWSSWELLWLGGPILIAFFLIVPETSSSNILLRRAQRLRARTGLSCFKSDGEIKQSKLQARQVLLEALWRPLQTTTLDPSIGFTALYVALIYGIYYSFFECFPLVYGEGYGFSLGSQGLVYLSIFVGISIGLILYWIWIRITFEPAVLTGDLGPPERRLVPALYAAFALPIGLFLFAWTATPSIHWIVPTIGVTILSGGIFMIIQPIFLYLPLGYPQYAASVFAGNNVARAALAAGVIHFSQPLYENLGIARGVTLLAGLTVGCIAGIFTLWYYGASLRARSKFAP